MVLLQLFIFLTQTLTSYFLDFRVDKRVMGYSKEFQQEISDAHFLVQHKMRHQINHLCS